MKQPVYGGCLVQQQIFIGYLIIPGLVLGTGDLEMNKTFLFVTSVSPCLDPYLAHSTDAQ